MLPRKRPHEGVQRDNWTFTGVPAGEWWLAYLAGQPWWYQCHRYPRSKPCLARLTEGAIPCEYPNCASAWYWFGYCPVFAETNLKPVVVGLHEHSSEVVAKIPRCARVRVARGSKATDAVSVTAHPGSSYVTTRADRMREPDLSSFLLRIWKLPALTQWLGQRSALLAESPPSAAPPVPSVSDGPPDSEHCAPEGADSDAGAQLLRELMARAGMHPKPRGPTMIGDHLNGSH